MSTHPEIPENTESESGEGDINRTSVDIKPSDINDKNVDSSQTQAQTISQLSEQISEGPNTDMNLDSSNMTERVEHREGKQSDSDTEVVLRRDRHVRIGPTEIREHSTSETDQVSSDGIQNSVISSTSPEISHVRMRHSSFEIEEAEFEEDRLPGKCSYGLIG